MKKKISKRRDLENKLFKEEKEDPILSLKILNIQRSHWD